nr:MAG TPA: hypothetical protein [Caudoviricetes sp.]
MNKIHVSMDKNYTNWAVDNYIPSVYNLRQQNTR